jgi:hypothetical protein
MNLIGSRGRLDLLTRELLRNWEETKGSWRDAKAQEFERVYLQELAARVGKAITATEKLDAILTKIHEDCD